MLPRHRIVRIERAERAGSSWPLVALDEHGDRWLVKLRGAAQGPLPLVAEVIVAGLAEALGLRAPARACLHLDGTAASTDRHEELRDLLARSHGDNLGLAFVAGARVATAAELAAVDDATAATVLWLDGLVDNCDRTAANPNLLVVGGALWPIDHGAALPFHFDWAALDEAAPRRARSPRVPHVFADRTAAMISRDAVLAACLPRAALAAAVAAVPAAWLPRDPERTRAAYAAYLWKRLAPPRPFVPAR